ncbi:3'-5' exonuclease [Lutispora thermophila]|uniref:Exonuclease, DNA polymerase III, epsilon subunit family n=1 Tax=Lutispora thermophila DSM 19022 TaxID=1122184 RepID=A0A1M6DSS1_9FIRM|nr:3'-5' exonuclease [Lutispora thermophila]SHI76262.1 exonuclease, DNA polymerase III, epsilon subunit family [Lutispora thermophila DSM 19022]
MKIPRDFVAFDLETTGLAPPCKILEIGAVRVINNKIVDEFQTFVDPCCTIPKHITEINGINQQMVRNAPKIEDALPLFLKFIEDLPIAAHNVSFDMKFINYEGVRLGYHVTNKVIDTLALSRRHYPGLENHKLNTVAHHLGIINKLAHRGLYDALVVAEILIKMSQEDKQVG